MARCSTLQYLTKGSAWTNTDDDIGRMRTGDIKDQLLMVAVVVGMEDIGNDGYRQSDKKGGG